ncbi:GDSL-type esterase/lipase family protein [bacterium]|nr:GDSL-type esterase/lipase family protein [bacterium]
MKQFWILILIVIFITAIFFFLRGDEYDIANIPPKNDVIIAFGDSLVEGVGSEQGGGFVSILEARFGIDVVNLGVAGDTTAAALKRLPEALSYDPGIAIVLLGGNDALRRVSQEETEKNLSAILATFREQGAVMVLLSVRGGIFGDPYDEMYEVLAEKYGAIHVPNVLEDILLRPEFTYDQLHPNDKGYTIVADRVEDAMRNVMK